MTETIFQTRVERLLDRTEIFDLVRFERLCRDQRDFAGMVACYVPGAPVRTTWFDGTVEEFAEASRKKMGSGSQAKHWIMPARLESVSLDVRLGEREVGQTRGGRPFPGHGEHQVRNVEAVDRSVRTDLPGESQTGRPAATAEIEHRLAGRRRSRTNQGVGNAGESDISAICFRDPG